MKQRTQGSVTLIVIILLAGIVFAVSNVVVLMMTTTGSFEAPLLDQLYRVCPPCVLYFGIAPVVVAILVAIMVWQLTRTPASPAATASHMAVTPALPSPAPALRLLALLQQEGRLIDFIAEDIDGYSDEQVGAAVRSIHAGCRKALDERITLQRIFADEEGSAVLIESGFDPAAIRLTGNVAGAPPFRGTLQHGGWRAVKVALPESTGASDPHIIEPAEVEIS